MFITLTQNIYNNILETNYVSRVYNAAAILWLQFMVNVMLVPMINVLYLYTSTFRRKWAVPDTAVFFSSMM